MKIVKVSFKKLFLHPIEISACEKTTQFEDGSEQLKDIFLFK